MLEGVTNSEHVTWIPVYSPLRTEPALATERAIKYIAHVQPTQCIVCTTTQRRSQGTREADGPLDLDLILGHILVSQTILMLAIHFM